MSHLLTKLKSTFSSNAEVFNKVAVFEQNNTRFQPFDCSRLSEFDTGWQPAYVIHDMSIYSAICS
jgi:hypothetical protein